MTLTAQGKVTPAHEHATRSTPSTTRWPTSTTGGCRAAASSSRRRLTRGGTMGKTCTSTTTPAGCCRPASTSWPTPSRYARARRAATSCSSASRARRRSPTTASRSPARSSSPTSSRTWARSSSARSPTRRATSPATARRRRRCSPSPSCARACACSTRRQPDAPAARHRGGDRAASSPSCSGRARPVEGRAHLAHIATIAAKEDERIGRAVADALTASATRASSPIEEADLPGICVDFVEGLHVENGHMSPYLVPRPQRMETVSRTPTSS